MRKVAFLSFLLACNQAGFEPTPVSLGVTVSKSGLTRVQNDLGWTVEVSVARVAVKNLEFTIRGETHALQWEKTLKQMWTLFGGTAIAHAGHYAGGEVTGEMQGDFILDFTGTPQDLGKATLLPGDYNGFNMYFRKATSQDELEAGDPLLGHSAVLEGTAKKENRTIKFVAYLDIPVDKRMVGGVFDKNIENGQSQIRLAVTLYTEDPSEHDSLFDGIDFAALDQDNDGEVEILPGQEAHNVLMKTLVRHDHWGILVVE